MKPTTRVSIGGLAFNLDEDAYRVLDDYLKALRKHFSNSPESNEIIGDIESRLSELLQMRVNNPDGVVSMSDALDIIKIMGSPKDFEEADKEDAGENTNSVDSDSRANTSDTDSRFRKKLFRDTDNKIIGGVCSGLGHYFRVDPIVMRLMFVGIFLFLFWVGNSNPSCMVVVFTYIILWIVMPAARSFTQKLSMAGADPSIQNIENRSQVAASPRYRGSSVGSAFNLIINIIVVCVLVVTFFILIGTIISMLWLYFDTEILGFENYMILTGYNTVNFKLAIVLACLIPIVGLLSFLIKILRRSAFKTQTLISFIIGLVVWLGAVAYLTNEGVKFGISHQDKAKATELISVDTVSDTLFVELGDEYSLARPLPGNGIMLYRGQGLNEREISVLPQVRVREDSTLTDYAIEINKYHFDSNAVNARRKAEALKLDYNVTDSLLVINPKWYDNDNSWNMEYFEVVIRKPQDKKVILESPLKEFYKFNFKINGYDYSDYNSYYWYY